MARDVLLRIVSAALAALACGCGASAPGGGSGTLAGAGRAERGGPPYAIVFRPAVGATWRLQTAIEFQAATAAPARVETETVHRVLAVDEAGLRVVETRCEAVRLTAPVATPQACFPPATSLLDGAARPHAPREAEVMAGVVEHAHPVFLAYPPRAVMVGETWHDVMRWREPGATDRFSVDANYTLVSVTPRGDDLDAVVRMTGALTVTDGRDVPASERGGGEGRMTAEFVLEMSDGFLRETSFDMDFVIRIPAAEGGGVAPARTRMVVRGERAP